MKKINLFVMALTAACLTLAGCQKQNGTAGDGNTINDMTKGISVPNDNQAADDNDSTIDTDATAGQKTGERLKYKEVKVLKTDDTGDLRVKIEVDYPIAGPSAVVKAVRQYIMEQIEEPFYFGANSTRQKPHYQGDTDDYEALVNFYIQAWLEYLAEDQPPRGTHMETEFEIECKADNPRYASYEVKLFQFMGGAHPNRTQTGATFSMADGRRITRFFDKVPTQELIRLIMEDTDEENQQFVRDGGLPSTPPYLDDDEMKFVYQENEIAPNAAGIIEASIDIDDIRQYLNDDAKALFR